MRRFSRETPSGSSRPHAGRSDTRGGVEVLARVLVEFFSREINGDLDTLARIPLQIH